MQLKSDMDSIALLAEVNSEQELSDTLAVLKSVQSSELSVWEWLQENINVVKEAIKLKTQALVYAFHKFDGLGVEMWGLTVERAHGISLFKRYGNRLRHILWEEYPASIDDTISFLKRNTTKKILTWEIISEFCWVSAIFDTDEYGGRPYEISYSWLNLCEIETLSESWIEIVVLDELI